MIEEWASVIRVESGQAALQANRRMGCQRCESGQGCGGGLLGKLVGNRDIELNVPNPISDLKAGDTVVIGFPESSLLQGALLAYGLPMLSLLAGAALASWLVGGDAAAALGAISGGALGWLIATRLARQFMFAPQLLRRVGDQDRVDCWANPREEQQAE